MAEWIIGGGRARKSLSEGYEAAPVSADKEAQPQRDRSPHTVNTTFGTDFTTLSAVESNASVMPAKAAGLSPMTVDTAPKAGVTQMKKGGAADNASLYADSESARRRNKKSAGVQNDKQEAAYALNDKFVRMQTGPMIRLEELDTQKKKFGATPQMDAEVEALVKQLERIKKQRADSADTRLAKYEKLGWKHQNTPEKLQKNHSAVMLGASEFNPFLMTDKHISQNYMDEHAKSGMYHGLMTDLLGSDDIGKDNKALRGTLAELKKTGDRDLKDTSNYDAIMERRFERIQKTGSSEGWEEEFIKEQEGQADGQEELDSLERMRDQAKTRLATPKGRKRWMKN